ncbi:glycosyltransferase like family 2-domain-containing protein [Apodospora peruviana]|uniref:Glycosyltransferase like family 2-domain-containing protein n=1 Tax=Apodospora peruviana TaxID=516989 RepID=A0AAE0HUY3_9PEZI|nr:glycosyltransferase like family 2-domain-containing protein [Apodospora peruviana]
MFSRRSKYIVLALQYNFISLFLIAFPVFYYFNYYGRPSHLIDESITFDLGCAVALLILLPGDGVRWLNILFNLWPARPDRYRNSEKVRTFSRLLICMASKGDNIDASVNQTVRSMKGFTQVHPNISFHIVTEDNEPQISAFRARFNRKTYPDVSLVAVPKSFSPKRAIYKARALEYFRLASGLGQSDWVLHLDEETFVDAYALETCIDLIERTKDVDFAQGYIFYNNHGYWRNWLLTLGDVMRVADDLGRYQWQANCLGKPLFGVHGSFFLINGDVENATTWDTDNLVEDYWFSKRADALGFRYGWIPAIAREQSPSTVEDYVRQRRRWWRGIRSIGHPMASALCLSWTWTLIGGQLSLFSNFLQGPGVKMPPWLWTVYSFHSAVMTYGAVLALIVHDIDAGVRWRTVLMHVLLASVLMPWTSTLEAAFLLSAVFDTTKGFDVISK